MSSCLTGVDSRHNIGQHVYKEKQKITLKGSSDFPLNVSALPNGLYNLEINLNGQRIIRPISIQN